jgi:NADH dehydrogenase FAD-containing subunit/uncharacterized membrane protein YphA (DoxX/SURF4 family)
MLFSRGAARAGSCETGHFIQKFTTDRRAGLTFSLLPFVLLILPWGELLAHERWILTPEQIQAWSEKPTPELWSTLTFLNGSMILGFVIFTIGWIRLGFTGARELFPDLQARLGSFGYLVAPILRFCLAWVLISSAFGLEPRYGVERLASPTLFAPDLELGATVPGMLGLRWFEFVLGIGFLLGIYVRVCSVGLLLLALIGTLLFQSSIYSYAGALVGVAIYLLCQGPGSYFLPLPTHPKFLAIQSELASVPRQRAQAIMRVLTGINIFYLAMAFKVFQPNLSIAILTIHDIRLMGLSPETTTLLMTLVEFTAGILIIAGILLRPLSLFFLGAFLLFAALLPESWMAHALFYGVMLSFLFNGAGHFAMPEAKDKTANIVILGGTVAAIHAAMKIERLIGQYSNVKLTLIHDQPNVLFYPLLPEVIGGTMQPGNAVNPIRRVVPQTRVILGEAREINSRDKFVRMTGIDEKSLDIPYDELILALFLVPNLNRYPGLMAHAIPINSVGDALHIRKQVMNRVEQAELEQSSELRSRLLTFAVIGSGQRACATAEEINAMLETAKPSYGVLRDDGWHVHLYEDIKVPFSDFEAEIKGRRDRELITAGVQLFPDHEVAAVTPDSIVFADGQRQPVGLVVNSCFAMPKAIMDGGALTWPPETEPDLRLKGHPHVWATMAPANQLQGEGHQRRYLTTSDWMDLGKVVGQNAWAASQSFETQAFQFKKRLVLAFNMGRHSITKVFGWAIGGVPAWFLSRMTNLATMPGLERNLRILIDWTLDVPFRADIAVLAPDVTSKLQKLHQEAGDEIIRQGEQGETAYIIQSGRVEIIKSGKKVGELGSGDFFGEIALVSETKRTATVRCLTACELTVLSREDFQSLSVGSSVLAKAIKHQIEERTGKKLRIRNT